MNKQQYFFYYCFNSKSIYSSDQYWNTYSMYNTVYIFSHPLHSLGISFLCSIFVCRITTDMLSFHADSSHFLRVLLSHAPWKSNHVWNKCIGSVATDTHTLQTYRPPVKSNLIVVLVWQSVTLSRPSHGPCCPQMKVMLKRISVRFKGLVLLKESASNCTNPLCFRILGYQMSCGQEH